MFYEHDQNSVNDLLVYFGLIYEATTIYFNLKYYFLLIYKICNYKLFINLITLSHKFGLKSWLIYIYRLVMNLQSEQ